MTNTKQDTDLSNEERSFAQSEQEAILKEMARQLAHNPASINGRDASSGMTPLHEAAGTRNVSLSRFLFEQENPKVDPWIRDRWGRLAVDIAIETGNETLIELFHQQMFPEDYMYDFDPLDPPEGVTPIITPKPGL